MVKLTFYQRHLHQDYFAADLNNPLGLDILRRVIVLDFDDENLNRLAQLLRMKSHNILERAFLHKRISFHLNF